MAPFATRVQSARAIAKHPRIVVTRIEQWLGTRYTADTLRALKRRIPGVAFVWLMGADNMVQIPQWEEWAQIFKAVPIAVFSRATYSLRARLGKAAQRFGRARLREGNAKSIATKRPPAWVFLDGRVHPASATSIRAARMKEKSGSAKGMRTKRRS